jgi:signal transduction histidine kinase
MRTKAVFAFALLAVYLMASGAFISYKRQSLLDLAQQMEQMHAELESIAKAKTALVHAIVTLEDLLNSGNIHPQYDDIRFDTESIEAGLAELREQTPGSAQSFVEFERNVTNLKARRSRETLIALRDSEQNLLLKLDEIRRARDRHSLLLLQQSRELNRMLSLYTLFLFLAGLGVFGIAIAVYFARLAHDIGTIEARSAAVVKGYRGPPLAVTRQDEVGRLMESVNQMQTELFNRERQQEMSRQQLFHREKMAAVGALAAAVAHEVNNPINAISGIAQYTLEAIRSNRSPNSEMLREQARMTIEQSERIGGIMRQLSDLSAPHSQKPELLNLNDLVQASCSFIRYDGRFRAIDLTLDLDKSIPAVRAVSDHLTQVLMNLLINASDAMEGVVDRKPAVQVATRKMDGEVLLTVGDNGHGMEAATLARAFDQSFTTKPAGKGRGIGLYLCKSLVEESGGRIELESSAGAGTTVRIRIPPDNTLHAGAMPA